jgi:eukaryotic-like serine/threonine-protein kinase
MPDDDRSLLNGRYRLGNLLGEGAVGIVSRAWDEVLRRDVAVKMLKPAYATDARTVARFYAEARAAARLAHPHAVLVHDIVADRAWHAIVMEYVAGVSLERVLASEGRVGEARAVRYGREIAQALAAAHAGGLLHRDVKPSNVLITQSDSVKVADFGLAKAIVDVGTSTEAGRMIGSASYVSPEQAQGLALTPASDLYSLGVVLHRLVTGRLPFEGASPIAVAVAHVTAPAPREDELAREMSPALATIIARLLRKAPAERYASATDVAAALAAIETGSPRTLPAWDAPTVTAERVRARPAPRAPRAARVNDASARAVVAMRAYRALGIARGTVTALALFVVVIAGVRVVGDHHVTAAGLRHLTLRHAAHTALVELGLRPRARQQPASSADVAALESDPVNGGAGK